MRCDNNKLILCAFTYIVGFQGQKRRTFLKRFLKFSLLHKQASTLLYIPPRVAKGVEEFHSVSLLK